SLSPPISTLFPYTTLFRSRLIYHRLCGGTWLGAAALGAASAGVYFLAGCVRQCLGVLWLGGHGQPVWLWLSGLLPGDCRRLCAVDRKSTRLNSSHVKISYA